MRGIADTGYVLRAFWRSPLTLRNCAVLLGCFEAHLLPAMIFIALAVLPLYWEGLLWLLWGLPLPQEVILIHQLGAVCLGVMFCVLALFEYNRYLVVKYLYRLPAPGFFGMLVRLVQYAWLFISFWCYAMVPLWVVVFKHLFNITSMTYVVGEKRAGAAKGP
jgi:hypothetical protein